MEIASPGPSGLAIFLKGNYLKVNYPSKWLVYPIAPTLLIRTFPLKESIFEAVAPY